MMKPSVLTLCALLALPLAVPTSHAKDTKNLGNIHRVALKCNPAELRRLLNSGVSPSAFDEDGETALHAAAMADRPDCLSILLQAGVSPNVPAKDGHSALVNALHSEKHHHIRLLLNAGANPNQADIVNNTPLHTAAKIMDFDAVLLLLQNGANPHLKNKAGHTFQAYLKPDPYVPLSRSGKAKIQRIHDWLRANRVAIE